MRPPVQLPLFGPSSLHLYRWDTTAAAVPPRGNPAGEKYRLGALACVACGVLASFAAVWADCDCCPCFTTSRSPGTGTADLKEAA